jgi:hypothetical protein
MNLFKIHSLLSQQLGLNLGIHEDSNFRNILKIENQSVLRNID